MASGYVLTRKLRAVPNAPLFTLPRRLRAHIRIHAAAKTATALERIADGNLSNAKTVGNGVLEYRIDFGPGYRIYFGRDGDW